MSILATRGTATAAFALTLALALGLAASAGAQVEVQAFAGEPFGVGRIRIQRADAPRVDLYEADGRLLYPAVDDGPVRQLVRDFLPIDLPDDVEQYFLFRGDAPLTLRLHSPDSQPITVRVRRQPREREKLLKEWWKRYRRPTGDLLQSDDYPPQMEQYLTAMLSRRLDLPLDDDWREDAASELDSALGPLLGTQAARLRLERDIVLGLVRPTSAAQLPLPADAASGAGSTDLGADAPGSPDADAEDVAVEAIAAHVPEECLYVRFGSFDNYRWLGDTLDRAGGDLTNLISARGLDDSIRVRLERQLALQESLLSDLLGGLVISDVALIGNDTFVREGASLGMLFEARSGTALAAALRMQRQQVLEAQADAGETEVEIAGRKVALLSTPDGRVRSYYAVDGDYHLVAGSRALVERFFAAAAGERPLSAAADFRRARAALPLERQDAVYLFLSEAFLREFTGPRYRVETIRRLRAAAEIELVELALRAASAEGLAADTIDELVAAQLLPELPPLPDGSRTAIVDGRAVNTLRGPRGGFVPVPDVVVESVTKEEADDYRRFAAYQRETVRGWQPLVAGIGRSPLASGAELVTIDAVAPLSSEQNGLLSALLGAADTQTLAPVPGDLAALELVLARGEHVFLGLRDVPPPLPGEDLGPLAPLAPLARELPWVDLFLRGPRDFFVGYLGTSPDRGALDVLVGPDFGPPDAAGYSRGAGPLRRRQMEDTTVFSLDEDVLYDVTPRLAFEAAERPAQARLRIGELAGSQWGGFLDELAYRGARQTSEGNARFLAAVSQQLHVPPEEAPAAAEAILDARVICPLGGDYVLEEGPGGSRTWVSTAWDDPRSAAGGAIQTGTLRLGWFRGLEMDLRLEEGSVRLHAEMGMRLEFENHPASENPPRVE